MKRIICADLHLKNKDQFGDVIDYKNSQINSRTLHKCEVFKNALLWEPQEVYIVGDLFDSVRPSEIVRKVFFEILKEHSDIKFYLIAGNHETYNALGAGSSEGSVLDNVVIVGAKDVVVVNDITMCGWNRDIADLYQKAKDNENTYLLFHGEEPKIKLPFTHIFAGHIHQHFTSDTYNKFTSIGAMFKDNWGEEEYTNGYIRLDDSMNAEYIGGQEIVLKTFNTLEFPDDGVYDAIRYKLVGGIELYKEADQKEIQSRYKKTKIFVDLDIQTKEYTDSNKPSSVLEAIGHLFVNEKTTDEEKTLAKRLIEEGQEV